MIEMERAADTSSEISLVERRGWRRFLLRDHATEVAGLAQGDNPKPSPPDASYRAAQEWCELSTFTGWPVASDSSYRSILLLKSKANGNRSDKTRW